MPSYDGVNDDIKLNIQVPVGNLLDQIKNDPGLLAYLTEIVREDTLKMARRVGNTSGKYAQRQLPQGVINQNPSTKRIF